MLIQELLGEKGDIIERAMANPGLAPKRKPTIEQAMKAVAAEVEFAASQNVEKSVLPIIQDMYDTYTLMNGEYEDVGVPADGSDVDEDTQKAEREEYASGLDDAFELCLEQYEPMLSANWLGTNTIDTRLWEPNAVVTMARSVAKEVFKSLSYQKTPAQVLSNAGIVQADVEIYLEQHLTQTPEKDKAVAEASDTTLDDVVTKIRAQIGADFDQMEVYSDIELALDDDEILANGAGKRLGLDDDDVQQLQMAALEFGDDTADEIMTRLAAAPVEKPKRERKPKDTTPASAPKEGAVDADVLILMKNHGSTQDTKMSAALGVSRATYNNWLNKKNPFNPDGDQYTALRDELVGNINGLLEALAKLDGTEQMEVS